MRKTNFAAIAAGTLIFAGILGWVNSSNLAVEAKVSNSTAAQIDTFTIMSNSKNFPVQEFNNVCWHVFCGE
jgi:hypothetical protein